MMITRTFALLETVGGILGLGMSAYTVVVLGVDPSSAALFLTPNAVAVYAGYLLWRERKRGYVLSLVLQAAQIFRVTSTVFFYEFVLGLGVTIGFTYDRVFFYPKVGSAGWIGITNTSLPFSIGINFVAVLGLIYLWRCYARKKAHSGFNDKEVSSAEPVDECGKNN